VLIFIYVAREEWMEAKVTFGLWVPANPMFCVSYVANSQIFFVGGLWFQHTKNYGLLYAL
jgi:hypothetical protein